MPISFGAPARPLCGVASCDEVRGALERGLEGSRLGDAVVGEAGSDRAGMSVDAHSSEKARVVDVIGGTESKDRASDRHASSAKALQTAMQMPQRCRTMSLDWHGGGCHELHALLVAPDPNTTHRRRERRCRLSAPSHLRGCLCLRWRS